MGNSLPTTAGGPQQLQQQICDQQSGDENKHVERLQQMAPDETSDLG